MEEEAGGAAKVDALVEKLRAKVQERRKAGMYPPGLEEDLDAHFRRIAFRPGGRHLESVKATLDDLDKKTFGVERIRTSSKVPGGEVFHRVVAKALSRHSAGILEQVRDFADGVRKVLRELVVALEDPGSHVHPDLVAQVDDVLERLARYGAQPADSAGAVSDLRRRVEELEESERQRRFRPWFRQERFREELCETAEELRERQRDLAQHFSGGGPVMDIRCGRGEFLELLAELGVRAFGVEPDPELARAGADAGLDVRHGDGLAALAAAPDESLGGISLIRTVEHMTAQQLVNLVSLATDKLRPGGKAVIETMNPQSLYVLAHKLYLDPSYSRPVHAAYLRFLFQEAGFTDVNIEWRSPPAQEEALHEVGLDGVAAGDTNENWSRLNRLLFGPQEYALIAQR